MAGLQTYSEVEMFESIEIPRHVFGKGYWAELGLGVVYFREIRRLVKQTMRTH
jgi:hypothetical protein